MTTSPGLSDYGFGVDGYQHHAYLLPIVDRLLAHQPPGTRVFELGCGEGRVAAHLAQRGFQVTGVDPSASGIRLANERWPALELHEGSAYDDLQARFGQFPVVISLEVVEHLYAPRHFARTLASLVTDGGMAIVSTPYHGYLKNLALALSNRLEAHWSPLVDHGHIKFWSPHTLGALLREAGFRPPRFERAGRIPPFAKSMFAIAVK